MLGAMARIAPPQPNEVMARIAPRFLVPQPNVNFFVGPQRVDVKLFSKVQIDSKRGLG
jgi:hypothetical protein